MSFLLDSTKEQYEAWVENPIEKKDVGASHSRACSLCPNVYREPLALTDFHLGPICYSCAVECYPTRKWDSWDGVLEMRKEHSDYWEKIINKGSE